MRHRLLTTLALVVAAALGASALPDASLFANAAQAAVRPATVGPLPGRYFGLTPTRILDTRSGLGVREGVVRAGERIEVPVLQQAGVPAAGVVAIALNLSVVSPTGPGYIRAWADGQPVPGVSIQSFAKGQSISNLAISQVGVDGKVAILVSGSATHVVADVQGYYMGVEPVPGAMMPLSPVRVLDTRYGIGTYGAALPVNTPLAFRVAGAAGVPAFYVGTALLNVSVVNPTGAGYIRAYAHGSPVPAVSDQNYRPGESISELVAVPIGQDGFASVYLAGAGKAQVVVDVYGYFIAGSADSSGAFQSVPATRVLDTRSGVGAAKAPISAGHAVTLTLAGRAGVPTTGIRDVALTVTVVRSTAAGYIRAYSDGPLVPGVSNQDYRAGDTISALVFVPVGPDGKVALLLSGSGSADVVADVSGYVDANSPATADATAYQENPVHDGAVTAGLPANPQLKWTRNLGGPISYPVIADGRVFVTAGVPRDGGGYSAGNIYAFDAESGAVDWGPIPYSADGGRNSLTYDHGILFSLTANGQLTAFDASTGDLAWSRNFGLDFNGPPTASDGTVYVTDGARLFAVDEVSGAVHWIALMDGGGDMSSPAVSAGSVYLDYACDLTYRFDLGGRQQWTHTTGCHGGGGSSPVVHGDSVWVLGYPQADTGQVLSATTGQLLRGFSSRQTPVFSGTDAILTQRAGLVAVDAATGQSRWTQPGDGQLAGPPVVSGDVAYIASGTANVFGYSTTTGQQVWSAPLGSPATPTDYSYLGEMPGLAAGDGVLAVPAGTSLTVFG